jgi:hypothetical protein
MEAGLMPFRDNERGDLALGDRRLFDYRQQQRQQHGRTAAVDDELLRGGAQVADAYERP